MDTLTEAIKGMNDKTAQSLQKEIHRISHIPLCTVGKNVTLCQPKAVILSIIADYRNTDVTDSQIANLISDTLFFLLDRNNAKIVGLRGKDEDGVTNRILSFKEHSFAIEKPDVISNGSSENTNSCSNSNAYNGNLSIFNRFRRWIFKLRVNLKVC